MAEKRFLWVTTIFSMIPTVLVRNRHQSVRSPMTSIKRGIKSTLKSTNFQQKITQSKN